ncbi:MAG TPA: ATP-binding protein [Bryobacteraceae bacterium]|jgi:two-component system phosphate regulon sensor histidine kinase PhoR
MASISRRAATVAAITVVPLVIAVEVSVAEGPLRWLAPLWGLASIAMVWGGARMLAGRIERLANYVRAMAESNPSPPRLTFQDDEVGKLARTLSRIAPRIEQMVQGLSTELARREAILASMMEAVLAVDAKLEVSFCNEAFVDVVGRPITAGTPLIKAFRDPGLFQLVQRVVDSGETLSERLHIGGREAHWFEVHATPLEGSRQRGALAILHDITPMERMERMQRDFVANVSHEFRTPLATITGCAETLLDGAWEDARHQRKFLEVIQANSVRLTNIAADLITLSQIDTGRSRAEPVPVSVEEVVGSAIRVMEPLAGTREVAMRIAEVCPAQVMGHRLALEQTLVNLLDNAVKFNRSGGEVVVRAVTIGDQVEISVADTGIGIPADDLSRIFERFYRVDKARSRQMGGTGLGLSIVKQAVEQMRGTVRVESHVGKGSCFTIALPCLGLGVSS